MYKKMARGAPRAKLMAPDYHPSGTTSRPKAGALIHGHPAGGGTAAGEGEPSKAIMMTDGALNFQV